MPQFSRSLLTLLLVTLLAAGAGAQDHHFSQFFSNPLNLNPALTGLMTGRYRVSLAHRSQWSQPLETPYSTTAFAADFHYLVNPRKRNYSDAFGVGVLFVSDRVSEVNFNTNQMMVGAAFHKSLDAKNTRHLSLGAQLGVVQRNVSYDQLTFDDQFDGTSGYTGGTGESLPENNFAFGDYQLGLNYSSVPKRGISVFAGAALHHFSQPEQSFFFEATRGEEIEVTNTLYRRYSGYLNLGFPLTREITFSPRAYYYQQGPHAAANAGANFRFLFNDSNGGAFHVGAWGRPVRNFIGWNMEAVVGMVGLEINDFLIGLSYDVGVNGLSRELRHRGAFEFSVSYLGKNDDDEAVPCPTF